MSDQGQLSKQTRELGSRTSNEVTNPDILSGAKRVVLRHCLDGEDLATLLDMLGLIEGSQ